MAKTQTSKALEDNVESLVGSPGNITRITERPKLNLHQKICAIMKAMERVKKKGHNSVQHYDFVREADVLEAIRELLAEHQIAIYPSLESIELKDVQTKNSQLILTSLVMSFEIVDAETGESKIVKFPGQGSDVLDKGAPKAITAAQKYFVLKQFFVATGDDPEADEDLDRRVNAPPSRPRQQQTKPPQQRPQQEGGAPSQPKSSNNSAAGNGAAGVPGAGSGTQEPVGESLADVPANITSLETKPTYKALIIETHDGKTLRYFLGKDSLTLQEIHADTGGGPSKGFPKSCRVDIKKEGKYWNVTAFKPAVQAVAQTTAQ